MIFEIFPLLTYKEVSRLIRINKETYNKTKHHKLSHKFLYGYLMSQELPKFQAQYHKGLEVRIEDRLRGKGDAEYEVCHWHQIPSVFAHPQMNIIDQGIIKETLLCNYYRYSKRWGCWEYLAQMVKMQEKHKVQYLQSLEILD